ncbi:MAG: 16S rRNA (adenine(1518)-N(6)/adenine(1519)-N(6))-dimethyltransferase RsmA [Gammaproteobacteria bacterium]
MSRSPQHRPRKRFGQHFLHDPHIIRRIIEALEPQPENRIIEIGPGRGALTGPLLETVEALEVIEIDRDLARMLEEDYRDTGKLTVHCLDVLGFDFCSGDARAIRLVGNLPYNISTPLLFHLLDNLSCIEIMIIMLQKEVADRICAGPGNKEYGRLSVNVQAVCEVESLFTVGRGAFTPSPKVDSSVIRLRPAGDKAPLIADRQQFQHLVRTCFSRRRKTLRNCLKGLLDDEQIRAEGIAPDIRPEELPVEAFARLANRLHDRVKSANPD